MRQLRVKGMADIAGGGLSGNGPRILPEKARAVIEKASWPRPTVFEWLQREGKVAEAEMQRVFNCGIGMAVVGAAEHADAAGRAPSRARGNRVPIGPRETRQSAQPPNPNPPKRENAPRRTPQSCRAPP